MTSILDPSNLSQTPDISSWLSNQFVLYVVNLRQIYPKPLFYPQIPSDQSEYKIEVIVYNYYPKISLLEKADFWRKKKDSLANILDHSKLITFLFKFLHFVIELKC